MTDEHAQELPEETPSPVKKYLAMAVVAMVVLGINLFGLWWLQRT
jgi:hypothetical protein